MAPARAGDPLIARITRILTLSRTFAAVALRRAARARQAAARSGQVPESSNANRRRPLPRAASRRPLLHDEVHQKRGAAQPFVPAIALQRVAHHGSLPPWRIDVGMGQRRMVSPPRRTSRVGARHLSSLSCRRLDPFQHDFGRNRPATPRPCAALLVSRRGDAVLVPRWIAVRMVQRFGARPPFWFDRGEGRTKRPASLLPGS